MVLLVGQLKDGQAHGFHTHPTSGIKQKIGKEGSSNEAQRALG